MSGAEIVLPMLATAGVKVKGAWALVEWAKQTFIAKTPNNGITGAPTYPHRSNYINVIKRVR